MGRHVDKYPEALQPLYDLIVAHQQSICKDPRDRVFALSGLVPLEERSRLGRFFPDYTLKHDHVLIITLAHLIQVSPLIALQGNYEKITPDSDEVFLGLGVTSKARRKGLLLRAKNFYGYHDEASVSNALQTLVTDDRLIGYFNGDVEALYGRLD